MISYQGFAHLLLNIPQQSFFFFRTETTLIHIMAAAPVLIFMETPTRATRISSQLRGCISALPHAINDMDFGHQTLCLRCVHIIFRILPYVRTHDASLSDKSSGILCIHSGKPYEEECIDPYFRTASHSHTHQHIVTLYAWCIVIAQLRASCHSSPARTTSS